MLLELYKSFNKSKIISYFIDWYLIPIEARELVQMIIRRTSKTPKLTAGSIIILSIRNFGSVKYQNYFIITPLLFCPPDLSVQSILYIHTYRMVYNFARPKQNNN